jgi:hypothetical protein
MADYKVSLDDLRRVSESLTAIVDEFENAVSNSEALEAAIGRPFGRGELKDKAEDIETRWDIKRGKLAEELTKVRDHVDAVVDETEKLDTDAAAGFAEATA